MTEEKNDPTNYHELTSNGCSSLRNSVLPEAEVRFETKGEVTFIFLPAWEFEDFIFRFVQFYLPEPPGTIIIRDMKDDTHPLSFVKKSEMRVEIFGVEARIKLPNNVSRIVTGQYSFAVDNCRQDPKKPAEVILRRKG